MLRKTDIIAELNFTRIMKLTAIDRNLFVCVPHLIDFFEIYLYTKMIVKNNSLNDMSIQNF